MSTDSTNLAKRLQSRYGVTLQAASDGYTVTAPGWLLHCVECQDLMTHLDKRQLETDSKTEQRPIETDHINPLF